MANANVTTTDSSNIQHQHHVSPTQSLSQVPQNYIQKTQIKCTNLLLCGFCFFINVVVAELFTILSFA